MHTTSLSPVIAVHLTAALCALVLGPVAIWARKGTVLRPWVHRAAGYAWVTLMLLTALSALFIRDFQLPNVWGFSPIHLFIPLVLVSLFQAFRCLARKDWTGHSKAMQRLYWQACVGAGIFTLLPSRYLGRLVWGEWLGLLN